MGFYQKAAVTAAANFLFASCLFAAMPTGYTGKVFSAGPLNGVPQQIPGLVETPYFDEGGLDTTWNYFAGAQGPATNQGDCYIRVGHGGEEVSLQYFGDEKDFVSGNVHMVDSMCYPVDAHAHLGWIQVPGEWETYTVHVNTAGSYEMILHESVVAVPNLILVTFSGLPTDSVQNQPASIRPPNDHEQYHDWKWDTTATKLALDTGLYVVTLEFITGGWNFHAMKFVLDGASAVTETNQSHMQKGFAVTPIVNGKDLSVSYSLAQAGMTTVSVFDCAGRALVPATTMNLTAGSHVQKIELSNRGTGVHFVRIEQNGLSATRSFTITR